MGVVPRHGQQTVEGLQRRDPAVAAGQQYHLFVSLRARAMGLLPRDGQQALVLSLHGLTGQSGRAAKAADEDRRRLRFGARILSRTET